MVLVTFGCGPSSSGHHGTSSIVEAIPSPKLTPTKLLIPKLGVEAAVESVTADATGAMAKPANDADVAWWSPGGAPGGPGSTVIDGHLDWICPSGAGSCPSVFWHLANLRPGDDLAIQTNGPVVSYRMVAGDCPSPGRRTLAGCSWPNNAQPPGLWATQGASVLHLVTCAGTWDGNQYAERLIVTAVPA